MHKASYPRNDIDKLYISKKEEGNSPTLKIASMHRYKDSEPTLKIQRNTDYSDQKQHKQHKDQQNNKNQKKMGT